ncbi:hypothetical protein NC651_000010 [Populus alba x Populus x berolinensis]|nr:hypothetical protein NC651_000010 [Populus alba x Populus x berolinensis]
MRIRVLLDGHRKEWKWLEENLAEIERQELEANQLRDYINQLESRAFELLLSGVCCLILVEFKIAECQAGDLRWKCHG